MIKNRILRTEEEIEKSLNRSDITDINEWKTRKKILDETFTAQSEYSKKETELRKQRLELQKSEYKAEKEVLEYKLDNMSIQSNMANIQMYTDYVNAVNSNNKTKIVNYLKDGKVFSRWSMLCSVMSAATSCLGLYVTSSSTNIMFLFACAVMILISIINNKIINRYVSMASEFYSGDILSKSIICGMCLVSGVVISYSIYTNYLFWDSVQKSIVATVLYSCVFDITSVVLGLMSNQYRNLNFNKKTIENMQHNVKRDCKTDEEKINVKNVSNTVIESDCYTLKKCNNDNDSITNANIEKKEMYNKIMNIEQGTNITPSLLDMVNNRQNYYNWIKECEYVKKEGNKYYRI